MCRKVSAETSLGVLFALFLFSLLFLSHLAWQSKQQERLSRYAQTQQAWQLATNHVALRQIGEFYQETVILNQVPFDIDSQSEFLRITFPLGEILLEKP